MVPRTTILHSPLPKLSLTIPHPWATMTPKQRETPLFKTPRKIAARREEQEKLGVRNDVHLDLFIKQIELGAGATHRNMPQGLT